MAMLYEICIERPGDVVAAAAGGAGGVEMCGPLSEGGVTPSLGAIEACVSGRGDLHVNVLIRPRAGDFCFDDTEVAVMVRDIELARAAGAQGVVLGALTAAGAVDRPATTRLLDAAGDLTVTFHRAFDMTADPRATLDTLLELGFDRVLTSGQAGSAADAIPLLRELQAQAGERLRIVPAGGIDETNVARVVAGTGVREVHSTAMIPVPSPATYRNTAAHMGREIDEYASQVTAAEKVARLVALARSGSRDAEGLRRDRA
ncbi:MAG: copper homeostasis protein CutC [Candidatus Dormibacteraeota bacterium]|nr:copper homeostasis protein CutC [Candidatus Dormibacteraeota bacterium]